MSPQSTPSRWSRWTPAEKEFLKENYGQMSTKEIAATLGRGVETIRMQAGRLGLTTTTSAPWTDVDREFLRRNYRNGMSAAEIAERLGRTCGTVMEQAGKLGLAASRGTDWTEAEDDYLRANYATTPARDVAQHLGRTQDSVRRHARRLGLVPDAERKRVVRRAAIRHDYFSALDTPLKAYILGWLATDGYITNTIGIRLSVKDIQVVELIRDELAPLHEVALLAGRTRQYQGRTITGGRAAEIRLTSSRMKEDLARLGVTARKSHILRYPDIAPRLDNNFVLGCFEGDGCLHRKRDGRYQWRLYSASVPFLLAVQSHVLGGIGIELHGPYQQGSSSVYKLSCQHQERIRALDAWLHADVPGLARKRLPEIVAG